MIEHINYLFHSAEPLKEETQLDVFRMVIGFPYEPDIEVWCALHLCPNAEGLLICEFEKYADSFYTKDILAAKKLPAMTPIQTNSELSAEDFKKSTTSASKPLPVLEVARKRDDAHFSSLDIFNAMTQVCYFEKHRFSCADFYVTRLRDKFRHARLCPRSMTW